MFGLRLVRNRARASDDARAEDDRSAGDGVRDTARSPEATLHRLEWTVIRRLDGLLHGDYRSMFRGFGIDLADLREYQPHDDVRHIDWNVTARLQTPHVRVFQEDREVAAWFLVDLSGSVDFGSRQRHKRDLAVEFVGVMARLLTRFGNRTGAIIYRDTVDTVLPSRAGRAHVLHLLDLLGRRGQRRASGETDLNDLLVRAHALIPRRSVVFVVSDFISRPGWERALARLARRHEVVAVRLFDPLESALPDLGLVVMQDAETGEQMFVDTHDRSFRRHFERLSREREAQVRNALASAGVDCLELSTDGRLDHELLQFARLRKQRSQLAGGGIANAPAG